MMWTIPSIDTTIELLDNWTFNVYREHRNNPLLKYMGKNPAGWNCTKCGQFTMPKGTNLIVDRIYIRKGGEDFESITFRATNLPGSKSVRFWAKLEDVRN